MSTVELPAWAVQLRELPTLRQALHSWCLLSGMRRRTVTSMQWADVDWKARTLTVPAPKGGEPMMLPISRPMRVLLRFARRLGRAMYPQQARTWVWPSPDSATGHVVEIKERKLDKVGHALRSTFATVAEEAGVTSIARKALLGHAVARDVTERHYITNCASPGIPTRAGKGIRAHRHDCCAECSTSAQPDWRAVVKTISEQLVRSCHRLVRSARRAPSPAAT